MDNTTSSKVTGRPESASRRPAAAPAKDREEAFRAVMRKQVSHVALTIKHTDVQN